MLKRCRLAAHAQDSVTKRRVAPGGAGSATSLGDRTAALRDRSGA